MDLIDCLINETIFNWIIVIDDWIWSEWKKADQKCANCVASSTGWLERSSQDSTIGCDRVYASTEEEVNDRSTLTRAAPRRLRWVKSRPAVSREIPSLRPALLAALAVFVAIAATNLADQN